MKKEYEAFATPTTFHYEPDISTSIESGKKRAAAYCRVSTLTEEQDLSFESQVSYYRKLISQEPALTLVGIYADHGFSGLDMSKRKEFQRLIADCKAGLVDIIYVKSMSRFSRNAADTLKILKQLNTLGVRVLFEQEGLDSTDPSIEMLLNIYATLAQNESCSLSENVSLAYLHRSRLGNPPRNACYGYRIEKKGNDPFRYWVVYEAEAKVVRKIFNLAYQGYTIGEISSMVDLKYSHIPAILRNVVYKGDIITHRHIRMDYTSRKVIRNRGQHEQVYIEGHHKPIIAPKVFDEVQEYLSNHFLNGLYKEVRKQWFCEHPEIVARRHQKAQKNS